LCFSTDIGALILWSDGLRAIKDLVDLLSLERFQLAAFPLFSLRLDWFAELDEKIGDGIPYYG